MIEDGNHIEYSSTYEKVLEYLYDLQSDKIQLSGIFSSEAATTKRGILSQNSREFDRAVPCVCLWQLRGEYSLRSCYWLVGFYGISTFVGYLTPNPFLCN